ncbi:hypothetical protein B0H19DRAFT_1230668 [Mycena capillaripes]|nr:hypothetical protein B0H19DRAFT_1230668 [Mycena capillaripes]
MNITGIRIGHVFVRKKEWSRDPQRPAHNQPKKKGEDLGMLLQTESHYPPKKIGVQRQTKADRRTRDWLGAEKEYRPESWKGAAILAAGRSRSLDKGIGNVALSCPGSKPKCAVRVQRGVSVYERKKDNECGNSYGAPASIGATLAAAYGGWAEAFARAEFDFNRSLCSVFLLSCFLPFPPDLVATLQMLAGEGICSWDCTTAVLKKKPECEIQVYPGRSMCKEGSPIEYGFQNYSEIVRAWLGNWLTTESIPARIYEGQFQKTGSAGGVSNTKLPNRNMEIPQHNIPSCSLPAPSPLPALRESSTAAPADTATRVLRACLLALSSTRKFQQQQEFTLA